MNFVRFILVLIILLFNFISKDIHANDIQQQIEQYKSAIKKYESEGNQAELAKYLNKLAYLYWHINADTDAIEYFGQSVEINTQLGNKNALRTLYNNLGLIYSEGEEYQLAVDNFNKSLEINLKMGDKPAAASDYLNIALALQALSNYSESNSAVEKALEKALEMNNLELTKTCYGILGENYEKLGQPKKAAKNFEKFNSIAKHLQKKEMDEMASRTEEYEKQVKHRDKELRSTLDTLGEMIELNREMQLQNELLNKENLLRVEQEERLKAQQAKLEAREKTRRTQLFALSIVLALLLCIAILIFWQFSQKKRANQLLKDQNMEIERQKKEIEEQRDLANKQKKRITDSIQYAQRIQKAVLPQQETLAQNLNEYFILYRPKAIVSGDFYWINRKDNLLIVAAADCTGHGVPGAFMSMLGVAYLNEIVNKISINKHISSLNTDEILNQLREMVITSLHQKGSIDEPKDGMDISLAIIDYEKKKLQFSGANNPIYIIRNNELMHLKADKMPVSYHQKMNVPFTRQEFNLKINDRIYFFSDGYIDQFGGDKGMKFLAKNFRDLLMDIHQKTMDEQHKILNKTFEEWKGKRAQVDDVLLIGMKFTFGEKTKQSVSNIDWQTKTILIAEDTDVNYFLLSTVLANTKANLVRVKNGQEAIDYIENNVADLILMDINMPEVNGYEATTAIKKMRSDIPIIIQTAMHIDDEKEKAIQSGADDYLSKPIDLKTFMSKMEKFLG